MTKDEIVAVLADLYKITGYRVSLHAADYSEIAAYPKEKCALCRKIQSLPGEYERCVASDKAACKSALERKDTCIYTCRYGMSEAVSPLYSFGTLTGFLMMGQVYKSGANRLKMCDDLIKKDASGMTEELVMSIPTVDEDMLNSYVRVMTLCAQYLTLSNAIPTNKPSVAQLAREYICRNYHTRLTIKKICTEVGCSKSALITAFKEAYNTTVNAFITEVRLDEAVHLLEFGESKIGEIAEACGFSDQSYFSKVFSSRFGIPPSEYERNLTERKPFWR